jgi:hypothetical protein
MCFNNNDNSNKKKKKTGVVPPEVLDCDLRPSERNVDRRARLTTLVRKTVDELKRDESTSSSATGCSLLLFFIVMMSGF